MREYKKDESARPRTKECPPLVVAGASSEARGGPHAGIVEDALFEVTQ